MSDVASLSREEKEKLLKALEEDREFRYALMGLLGFGELLDRFARLEERQQRLEERFAELDERVARLEERIVKLEERFAELAERQQRLEERMLKLEERFARLEERFAEIAERQQKLEERFAKLEERMARLEEEMIETRRVMTVIAHRFGVLSEEAFREAMRYVVQDVLKAARVTRWSYRDEEGVVYGYPSVIEVDVVVTDSEVILVEVKSRAGRGDVAELARIGKLYEKVEGRKPRLVIVAGSIDPGAYEAAAKLGVQVVPATRTPLPPIA